jgi:myo-inositol-1(or 4)-monophosphatase
MNLNDKLIWFLSLIIMKQTYTAKQFITEVLPGVQKIILAHYKKDFDVEFKSDQSPVTIADREVEEFIKSSVIKRFPDHGIIGEESGNYNESAEYKWIVDPIDGTKSFVAGVPLFGTLIALVHNNNPVLGCIYLPVSGDTVIGDGKETFINNKPVRILPQIKIEESVILTTDYKDFSKYKPRAGFDKLINKCRISRTWGDCYGYYLLVSGKAHVMIDPAMSIWDKMALIPVIRGAGGTITDFYGNAPEDGDGIVASIPGLHEEVISILNSP